MDDVFDRAINKYLLIDLTKLSKNWKRHIYPFTRSSFHLSIDSLFDLCLTVYSFQSNIRRWKKSHHLQERHTGPRVEP